MGVSRARILGGLALSLCSAVFLVVIWEAYGNVWWLTFVAFVPREQRSWAAASSALAITASLAAPFPVPMFMLMVSVAGWLGRWPCW